MSFALGRRRSKRGKITGTSTIQGKKLLHLDLGAKQFLNGHQGSHITLQFQGEAPATGTSMQVTYYPADPPIKLGDYVISGRLANAINLTPESEGGPQIVQHGLTRTGVGEIEQESQIQESTPQIQQTTVQQAQPESSEQEKQNNWIMFGLIGLGIYLFKSA